VKLPASDLRKLQLPTPEVSSAHITNKQQLTVESRAQGSSTISEVLKGMHSSATVSEALASAHVNYTLMSSLLRSGKKHQAQQLLNVVMRDIEIIKYVDEARPLIESYMNLLKRHGLNVEAFDNCVQAKPTVSRLNCNPW
jgi:hypothetical protein